MCKRTYIRAFFAVAAGMMALSSVPGVRADDWSQWQGPDRNARSKETGLLQEWPKDGPPLVWKATGIGKGMGGISVSRGRIYTTGDDAEQTAWIYALNEADGKPAWSAKIGPGGNSIAWRAASTTSRSLSGRLGSPRWSRSSKQAQFH